MEDGDVIGRSNGSTDAIDISAVTMMVTATTMMMRRTTIMAWVSDVAIARTMKVTMMVTIKTLGMTLKNLARNPTNATLLSKNDKNWFSPRSICSALGMMTCCVSCRYSNQIFQSA